MGVTIRYRGQLADVGKIKTLCDELAQVAEKMNWAYNRLDEDWSKPTDVRLEHDDRGARIVGHLGLKGISFKPHPKCESISGSVIPSALPGCWRLFLKNMGLQIKIQRTESENGGNDQCHMTMTW